VREKDTMADFYTNQEDVMSHPKIVLELLKKITVELGTKEFRGGYKKPVNNGGVTYMDYIPDSRAEFIQAIEALSDILLPQYDKIMEKNYNEYIKEVSIAKDKIKDGEIFMGDEEHSKFTSRKLILSKRLFRDLNLLLKRTNYLKAAAYTEGDLED